MKVTAMETLACDAGSRSYHFVKSDTGAGAVGGSDYDEAIGALENARLEAKAKATGELVQHRRA